MLYLGVWVCKENVVFVICDDEVKIVSLCFLLNRNVEILGFFEFVYVRLYEILLF